MTQGGHNNIASHQEDHMGQKHHNKVAKTFVGEEVDDQAHPNMDKIIDNDGW
jgi:hypothetical protein